MAGQNVDHLLSVEDAFLSSPNVGGKAFCVNLSPALVRCLGVIRARACDRILNQSDAIRVALRYLAAALPDGDRGPSVTTLERRARSADSAALRSQERRARSAADAASGMAMLADAAALVDEAQREALAYSGALVAAVVDLGGGEPSTDPDPDPLGVNVAPGPVCEAPGNAGDAL